MDGARGADSAPMGRIAALRAPARIGAVRNDDTGLKARALAGLFAAGAPLALLPVLLPHSPRTNELGLLLIVADAYLVAALLHRLAERLPPRLLRLALAWGSLLITAVAYFSAERPSPLVFFYLWVFLYASYFFSRRETAAQVAFVGVAYGALLTVAPPPTGVAAWWAVGTGTLLVAAILVVALRDRSEVLIGQLYDAARTDPLTELLNRRGFRELLDLELERARRSDGRTTVVLGDLDHFKEVNDRSGHHVGDAALRRTARILEEGTRTVDAAARVGGEEFALILPDTDEDEALVTAERLRCRLQKEFACETVPVTICFGIAGFPAHGETAAALLRAGDGALYAAKAGGRNRTVVHSAELRELAGRKGTVGDVESERYLGAVRDLAEALDLRFSGSARHSETVGRYAEMMAEELGLPERRVQRIRLAGVLHDIGKVGVPDAILHKPGALTGDEWTAIRRHPELGAQILEHSGLSDIRGWVAGHHERPDGGGYPGGLAGAAVSLEARILAVADAYEAMTSDRSYRASLGHAAARAELERQAGHQFDPAVVHAFLAVLTRESLRAEAVVGAPR
ncbi:MAG TPA: diguanylate cyclase, partial [Solirubrobacteraceae bacterium]|nr:diguanylate cyclase [Solirubrobacteraceae bacterium]